MFFQCLLTIFHSGLEISLHLHKQIFICRCHRSADSLFSLSLGLAELGPPLTSSFRVTLTPLAWVISSIGFPHREASEGPCSSFSPAPDVGAEHSMGQERQKGTRRWQPHTCPSSPSPGSPCQGFPACWEPPAHTWALWPWLSSLQVAPSLFLPPKVAASARPWQTL